MAKLSGVLIHEAGHAVAGVLAGLRVMEVSAVRDGRFMGSAWIDMQSDWIAAAASTGDPLTESMAWRGAVGRGFVLLAGYQAHRAVHRISGGHAFLEGGQRDFEMLRDIIEPWQEVDDLVRRMTDATWSAVKRAPFQAAVRSVAAAVRDSGGVLDGIEAEQIALATLGQDTIEEWDREGAASMLGLAEIPALKRA